MVKGPVLGREPASLEKPGKINREDLTASAEPPQPSSSSSSDTLNLPGNPRSKSSMAILERSAGSDPLQKQASFKRAKDSATGIAIMPMLSTSSSKKNLLSASSEAGQGSSSLLSGPVLASTAASQRKASSRGQEHAGLDDNRSDVRVRLLPLDKPRHLDTPRSANQYKVPFLALVFFHFCPW